MRTLLAITVCCLQIIILRAEEDRIWIEASVNGNPAHFIFDTGDPGNYTLFRNGAQRLGVAVTNYTFPGDTNKIYTGYTPECSLKIDDQMLNACFLVVDVPPSETNYLSADGLIGWPSVTNCVVTIDAKAEMMLRFSRVPRDTTGWLKLPIQTDAPVLRLLVPEPNRKKSVIVVDTGSGLGISLRSDIWRDWRSSHTNQPTTLTENFNWGPGITIREETWAKEN